MPAASASRRLLFVVATLVVVLMTVMVARLSLERPITSDEAYNMQIATSIGTRFCYCTRYRPERVFPSEESTNGLLQYVGGALFAITHSLDRTKAGTTAAAMLVLGAALLALDPWLVFVGAFLLFEWYGVVYISINFLGESWAIAFSLLGIAALRRCDFSAPLRKTISSRAFLAAILCFAVASESKLLATLVVIPVTWAIAYRYAGTAASVLRLARASIVTACAGLGTALFMLLFVGFSVIHSTRTVNPAAVWQTFAGYILNMIGQGQGQARPFDFAHVGAIISSFDNPAIIALFAVSAAVLLYADWAYVFFVLVTLAWWLHYGIDERHLIIAIYMTIVLAAFESRPLIERLSSKSGVRSGTLSLAAAAGAAALVFAVTLVSHGTFYAPGKIQPFPNRKQVVLTSQGRFHYSPALVRMLRRQRYVVTSGWFQFSELSLREHLEFYDRMSPANADLPRDRVALLFDTGITNWPLTSVKGNCARILYAEGPLVLCAVKRSVPLDFQPKS